MPSSRWGGASTSLRLPSASRAVRIRIDVRIASGLDGTLPALATAQVDTNRYNNVWNVDFRLGKNMKLGSATLTLSAEVFNALNSGVVLSRYRFADGGSFTQTIAGAEPGLGRIEEVLSPRIVRFGIRYQF